MTASALNAASIIGAENAVLSVNCDGFMCDIPSERYHASPGVSSSGLKLFARSPLHYYARYLDPERQPEKQTPALVLGTQIHTAVLEPGDYFQRYHPLPRRLDRRLKEDKLEYEFQEQQAEQGGKQIISREDHETCQRIAEAVHKNDAAAFLFDMEGMIEKSFYWYEDVATQDDGVVPVLCKVRPDKYLNSRRVILDLKSCDSADYGEFQRSVMRYDYHLSMEFYRRGVQRVTGEDIHGAIWAAFEKAAPFAAAFYQPDEEMLASAGQRIDRLLSRFAECMIRAEWPGYPQEIQGMTLPGWAVSRQ